MDKKILAGSIIAIVVIILASFTTVVGFQSTDSSKVRFISIKKSSTQISRGDILYVGGSGLDNYSKIQDAIDNASIGDTVFVFDDSSPYYERIVIDKTINLIGENRDTTVIDGESGRTVITINNDNILIDNFTIKNGGTGVDITGSYNTISNCKLQYSYGYAIVFAHTFEYNTGNVITRNNISYNYGGISTIMCETNIFSYNEFCQNENYAIGLMACMGGGFGNLVYHNNFIRNNEGGGSQGYESPGGNYWYAEWLEEGNYWSDYNGTDADGDGIGDTPYYIEPLDEDCTHDQFPLMRRVGEEDVTLEISIIGPGTTNPPEGMHVFPYGTIVDIEAFCPNIPGIYFAYWTGDVPMNQTNDDSIEIFMDDDKEITANFWSWEVSPVGTGDVTVILESMYPPLIVTLIANASYPDWTFKCWSGDIDSTENPIKITIEPGMNIIAEFELETQPHLIIEICGEMCNDWYVSDVEVTMYVLEYLREEYVIMYELDEESWQEYDGPFTVSDDGEHILLAYYIDSHGNQGDTITVHCKIDQTPPTVNITRPRKALYLFNREIRMVSRLLDKLITGPNNIIIIGCIRFEISIDDATSGINETGFFINDVQRYGTDGPITSLTWNERAFGTYEIKFVVYDGAGNMAEDKIDVVMLNPWVRPPKPF